MVKLQESPGNYIHWKFLNFDYRVEFCTDDMPAGQTPHTVVLFAHNDLVDAVQPGDRVTVTG